jgi:hypothetical protein
MGRNEMYALFGYKRIMWMLAIGEPPKSIPEGANITMFIASAPKEQLDNGAF